MKTYSIKKHAICLLAATLIFIISSLVTLTNAADQDSIYYDIAEPRESHLQSACPAYPTISEHQQRLNDEADAQQTDPNISFGAWQYQYTTTIYENSSSCKYRYHFKRSYYRFGSERDPQWTSAESVGTFVQVETCPPQPRHENDTDAYKYTIGFEHETRGLLCVTEEQLAEVDTCDVNGPLLPTLDTQSPQQCIKKPDGSMCRYNLRSTNNQYYLQPATEPDHCYTGGLPITDSSDNQTNAPNDGECMSIGGQTSVCKANPNDVCDSNGFCQPGCGNVEFNGVAEFVCFSGDFDGDGVPDFQDPDIDGDGIPNDMDLDNDNDGIDDPYNFNDRNNFQSPFSLGDVNSIKGALDSIQYTNSQIAQNTSQLNDSMITLTNAMINGEGEGTVNGQEVTLENQERISNGIEAIKAKTDEITEGVFSAVGGRENVFTTMFNEEYLEGLKTQAEGLLENLNESISTVKTEASAFISVPTVSATFQSRQLEAKGKTVDLSFSRFTEHFTILGLVLVFVVTCYSFFIVLGGSKS